MLGDNLCWLYRCPQNVLPMTDDICARVDVREQSGAILRCDGTVWNNTQFVAIYCLKAFSTYSLGVLAPWPTAAPPRHSGWAGQVRTTQRGQGVLMGLS